MKRTRINYKIFHETGRKETTPSSTSPPCIPPTSTLPTKINPQNTTPSFVSSTLTTENSATPSTTSTNYTTAATLSTFTSSTTIKTTPLSIDSMEQKLISLKTDIKVISDEINDFVDENVIDGNYADTIAENITRIEQFRTQLRRIAVEFQSIDLEEYQKFNDDITRTFDTIKNYIKSANDYKLKLKIRDTKLIADASTREERSLIFVVEDTQHRIAELEHFYTRDIKKASDQSLLQWQKDISNASNQFEMISQKYQEILKSPINNADLMLNVKEIGKKYSQLVLSKCKFQDEIEDAIASREIEKRQHFNESKLNIKIDKFSGYDSAKDIYTFQEEFEKVYNHTTPNNLLPDLLKNNFLTGPALSLVKSIDNISSIWCRLHATYGDTKILLTKKIQAMHQLKPLSNVRDPEKLMNGYSNLINTLRDLLQLVKKHHIESHLYYGNGLDKVYQLLGDNITTRWLSHHLDEKQTLSPKETWIKLIAFLEKEQRLQQQRLLVGSWTPKEQSNSRLDQRSTKHHSHYSNDQSTESSCNICGDTEGHVATSGPQGTKLFQYFTCKKFVNSTPASRLKMLRDKNFCIQCLFPGADAHSGKHKEGRCQRDFVCPHPSHSKYPVKKHILVCEEHKDDNQDLLTKYTQRFIRSPSLPDFSRNLSLLGSSSESHKISNSQCNDRGIYLMQRILVDGQSLLVFFDNGCSDFVISKDAVNKLGPRCNKESSNPVTLGGVGNCKAESKLGMYSVKLPLHNGRQISLSGVCLEKITSRMPEYPIQEDAQDIQRSYSKSGGSNKLPNLPSSIGGEVDLMVGVKYLRYHPKLVYQLSSGLALYESPFNDAMGQRGVVGGPHRVFTKIHQNQSFNSTVHHILRRDQQPFLFSDSKKNHFSQKRHSFQTQ